MRYFVVAVLLVTSTARADTDSVDDKSPVTAALLSAGGTVAAYVSLSAGVGTTGTSRGVAIGVAAASWLALPSLGHWYAHDWLSTGLVIRAASIGIAVLAAHNNCEDECASDFVVAGAVFGVLTGAVWDLATAPGAASDYNAAHRHVTIAPTVLTPPSGPVIGVGVTLNL